MNAPAEARRLEKKDALRAAVGAVLFTIATVIGTLVFLHARGAEQRRVLDERSRRCGADDATACDQLRAACLRRSGDACASLAEALLVAGPRHDEKEARRILSEACTYHHRDSCVRAARMFRPEDGAAAEQEAQHLLARGCELGSVEACALVPGGSR